MSKRISLLTAVPDIGRYWDWSKNEGKEPSDFSASASAKVWTLCPICRTSVYRNVRYTWQADENGVGHVIHCRTCGKRSIGNALVHLFPAIKHYWCYDKNEHDPEYYAISSGKKVYIKCPDCGKEREIAVCDALNQDKDGEYYLASCRECGKYKGLASRRQQGTSIRAGIPDIEKYWDPQNSVSPDDITVCSTLKIYLRCPTCGKLLYRMALNSFKKDGDLWRVLQCQVCASRESNKIRALKGNGSVIDECPEIVEWWDEANNTVPINDITRGSHYIASLICPVCHKTYNRDLHKFISRRRDGRYLPVACPECGYSSVGDPIDNLLKECPEIAQWWDYEKNSPFKPEQFTRGCNAKAYLKCPDCGLEMYSDIKSYTVLDADGKYVIAHKGRCRKYRAMASELNLMKNYPEVKDWWDYERNAPDSPEEYTLFSQKRAYFKCPDCGAETYRRIADAFFRDDDGIPILFKCPYCNDRKVLPGYNSFQVKHPDLVEKEWSTNENMLLRVNPDRILDNYSDYVWWKCPVCDKKYMMSVKDRLMKEKRGQNPCTFCNGRRWKKIYNI